MNCPKCGYISSKVVDKRNNNETNTIRRRRECLQCSERYTTYEKIERTNLLVRKKSGRVEEYDRSKLKNSLLKGLKKRAISEDKLERFIDELETNLQNKKKAILDTKEIGLTILEGLKKLDKVAYLLYATVYKDYNNIDEIALEIQELIK